MAVKEHETVTTLGSEEFLHVETDEPLQPNVTVEFTAGFTRDDGFTKFFTFEEALVAEPSTPRDPASPKKASRIRWKVNLGGNKEAEKRPCRFSFDVRGLSQSGSAVFGRSDDIAFVDTIPVTTDPKLTRIMFHEFARKEGGNFVFDPAPAEAFVAGLSPQQRKMLLNYDVSASGGNRLVVFITLYPQKPLLMGADFCQDFPTSVIPNATFTVFHCRGPRKGATLVCHTEHFLLNLLNGPTRALIHAKVDGRNANDWTDKRTDKPVLFKLASMRPQGMNDGVIWSRCFRPDGTDVMKGNTMHGIINTVGCWMLFRNYNWPRANYKDFERIYTRMVRRKSPKPLVKAELAKLGYDAGDDPAGQFSSSLNKFFRYDLNFAYLWFFHEVVGIKYFSDKIAFMKDRNVNDFKPHGLELVKALPLSELGKKPDFNLPEEGDFAYHDSDRRRALDKSFKPGDDLWRDNALGFRAASGFIPETGGVFGNLSKSQLDASSWADLYFFREEALGDINKLQGNYA